LENKISITYAPIHEIIVHEIVKVELEDLKRERVTPSGTLPLYWCSGIIFSFSSLPMSRKVLDDYLDGRIHWMEVHFSQMKEYSSSIELKDEQHYSGKIEIRVIDTSKSNVHQEFIKWLKKNTKV